MSSKAELDDLTAFMKLTMSPIDYVTALEKLSKLNMKQAEVFKQKFSGDTIFKCKSCGSTEDLTYQPALGNEAGSYWCSDCTKKFVEDHVRGEFSHGYSETECYSGDGSGC